MKEKFWWGIAGWVGIVLVTFIIACGVRTGEGRDLNNHVGPRPAEVVQLTGNLFLLNRNTDVLPQQICLGKANGAGPIDQTTRVPQLSGTLLVQCTKSQTWNDHRKMGKGFFRWIGPVATDPKIEFGMAIALLACLLPFLTASPGQIRLERRRKAELELKSTAKRDALAASFARDEISEEEFDRGLERIKHELEGKGGIRW